MLALAFGFIKIPDYLGIVSRTICLYPFFLFGFLYKQIKLNQIFQKKLYKIISCILIILTFISAYFVFNSIDMDMIFYLSYDYAEIWFRVLRYAFSILLFISFLIIIPNNQKWYTCFGARTKTIYLYHVFLAISLSCAYDLYDNSVLKLFVMIIVAFLICLLTGNKWFVKYTKYTTEIRIKKRINKKQD